MNFRIDTELGNRKFQEVKKSSEKRVECKVTNKKEAFDKHSMKTINVLRKATKKRTTFQGYLIMYINILSFLLHTVSNDEKAIPIKIK